MSGLKSPEDETADVKDTPLPPMPPPSHSPDGDFRIDVLNPHPEKGPDTLPTTPPSKKQD